ncbi:hypothetical protein V495_00365, partial [Pseudogymnoascus sp. VKM F-4514 (FW-929)]
ACSFVFLIIAYFFFPETKQKTLEEIAAAFGDRVISATDDLKQASVIGDLANSELEEC